MATKYRINIPPCESCGACLPACPFAAITEEPYYINPYLCEACGECADVCPYEAIEEYEWEAPPGKGPGLSIGLVFHEN